MRIFIGLLTMMITIKIMMMHDTALRQIFMMYSKYIVEYKKYLTFMKCQEDYMKPKPPFCVVTENLRVYGFARSLSCFIRRTD